MKGRNYMKVRCIDNSFYTNSLTIGKIYDVINCYDEMFRVLCDKNYEFSFRKHRFEIVNELNNIKLKEIIVDIQGHEVKIKKNSFECNDKVIISMNDLDELIEIHNKYFKEEM